MELLLLSAYQIAPIGVKILLVMQVVSYDTGLTHKK